VAGRRAARRGSRGGEGIQAPRADRPRLAAGAASVATAGITGAWIAAIAEDGKRKWGNIAKILEAAIGDKKFIVGNAFTGADVALGSAMGWVGFLGILGEHPKLEAYHKGLMDRPAYQRAYAS